MNSSCSLTDGTLCDSTCLAMRKTSDSIMSMTLRKNRRLKMIMPLNHSNRFLFRILLTLLLRQIIVTMAMSTPNIIFIFVVFNFEICLR